MFSYLNFKRIFTRKRGWTGILPYVRRAYNGSIFFNKYGLGYDASFSLVLNRKASLRRVCSAQHHLITILKQQIRGGEGEGSSDTSSPAPQTKLRLSGHNRLYPASRGFSLVFLSVILPFSSLFWLLAFCFGCFCAEEKTSADSRLRFLLSMRIRYLQNLGGSHMTKPVVEPVLPTRASFLY